MPSLLQVHLLCWAWIPLCRPSTVSYIGTPQECKTAHFVPGYNLGGEGFNIVTMERCGTYVIDTETWNLGNGTCRLYRNTYRNGEMQKTPAAVIDWRTIPQCNLKVSGLVYDSVESLVNDSTSAVTNDWKLGLTLPLPSVTLGIGLGGSHSKMSNFAMKKSKQDRCYFCRHSVGCSFYKYRLANNAPLSSDFKSAINALPPYTEKTESLYSNLIDTYGTHYITQVSLGGEIKKITSVRTCQATMDGLEETEVQNCLAVEASANFNSGTSIQAMVEHCQAKKEKLGFGQSFSSKYNDHYSHAVGGNVKGIEILMEGQKDPALFRTWFDSLKTQPDVVQYKLKPLHNLLPRNHPAADGVKRQVENYIMKNAVLKTCSETCEIGQRAGKRDPCACVCKGDDNIKPNCCPAGKGRATLRVFNLFATELYGDYFTRTDGSVEVTYGDQHYRTSIISNNDNPVWQEDFNFGPIILNMKDKLILDVYDEDSYWNSDHLGSCSLDLGAGRQDIACMMNHGTLFLSYTVTCAPSLAGHKCQEYVASPMSPPLAKIFQSRNGVLYNQTEKLHPTLNRKPALGQLL